MDEHQSLAERLQKVKQFNDIPLDGVRQIVSTGIIRDYQKGEIIFHEADPCSGLFVLMRGQVNLSKLSPEGKEGILNTLDAVIMFNEVAALDGGPNPVTAIAHTDIRVWRVNHQQFQGLLREFPQIGISLLGVLARRNRLLLSHYGDLSFRSVQARLAKHLVTLSENGSRVIDRRENPIHFIAARIITTPEAVSRTLKVMKSAQVIKVSRSQIEVLDKNRLQELAKMDI